MLPRDLGLPPKFESFRPHQLEVAAKVANDTHYAFLLEAATGTGKTIISATSQKLMKTKAVHLVATKQLQDQILGDFPEARTLKGRSSYVCLRYPRAFPAISAELCTNTRENPCNYTGECPYMMAKRAALRAPLAVLNMAYYLTEANFVGSFSGIDYMVADELDTTEDHLMSFIQLVVTKRQLDRLGLAPPKHKTKFESWLEWGNEVIRKVDQQVKDLAQQSYEWGGSDIKTLRQLVIAQSFLSKLKRFVREVDSTWVWYPGEDRWVFKPTWVSKYAKGVLWRHTSKVLGMSATILDAQQVCRNIGLSDTWTYLSLPSPFPVENRPVIYRPCANMTNKTLNVALPKIAKGIEDIMNEHPDERILCHTVSYKVRNYLMDNLPKGRLVTHSTADRTIVLEAFKKSEAPLVLLSPSMERGVDLPDDQCRVVIIAKIPWPDMGDPQISRRLYSSKDGRRWYAHKTVSTIVQASGRAMRSATDYCCTYILDEQFTRLLYESRQLFPKWYIEAIKGSKG